MRRLSEFCVIASRVVLAVLVLTCFPVLPDAFAASASSNVPNPREDDDATMRRDARRFWYGGDATPSYRRFLHQAAEAERRRRSKRSIGGKVGTLQVAATSQPTWINLGPTRATFEINGYLLPGALDSGRISSIVVNPLDPNVIYIATSGGGAWKTADAGTSWVPLTDSLGELFVGALEMDPSDPNLLYLGLGDPFDSVGTGVGAFLTSTDGGTTWSGATPLSRQNGTSIVTASYIKQLLTSPLVHGLILAATDVGLFRSVDSGVTWSPIDLGVASGAAPVVWSLAWTGGSGFAVSVVNPAATSNGGHVYISRDAGATWSAATGLSSATGIARVTLASAPSNRALLYALAADGNGASLGDLFRSFDGGSTWLPLNAPQRPLTNPNPDASTMADLIYGQAWYDQVVLVSPTDPNVAYFGGQVVLAMTTNGGQTFSQLTNWTGQYGLPYVHADFQCGTFDSAGNLYIGTDGGIFKSADGGQSWTSRLNVGIVSHLLYSIGSSLANRDAVIGGLQDNGTRVRAGATSTFNQLIGGDGFGSHVHSVNPSLMLGSMYFTQIYRSNNGGNSFALATNGISPESSYSNFYTKIVPGLGDASGNTVYTLGANAVYRSTDYADTWTPLAASGLPSYALRNIGASRSNPLVLGLVAEASAVYLSADGGSSWTLSAPLPNSGGALSSISFDTSNPQIIYVTSVARSASTNHAWKSIDGGVSWTALDGPTSGLPTYIPINSIVNDPVTPLRLYAGTIFGLYQSDDGGVSWVVAGSGLPMVDVTDVFVAPDSSFVRVATYGRGFWELATATPIQAFTIVPTSVPNGVTGIAYQPTSLFPSGGTGPWSFSVTAGALPGGLTLSSAGLLGGTPLAAGLFTFRATATDSTPAAVGGPLTGSRDYTLVVSQKPTVVLSPAAVPGGTIDVPYPAQVFSATGATPPYSFSVSSGFLPLGLALSNAGVLSGVPGTGGSFSFTVTAVDSSPASLGGPYSGSQTYSFQIPRLDQTINFPSIPDKYLGDPDFPATATAPSGNYIQFNSLTPDVCGLNFFPSQVHLIAVGTCALTADDGGSNRYNAAPQATQSFSVLPTPPDTTPPTALGLTCSDPSPTSSDTIDCVLTLSESVTGVSALNFHLATTAIASAAVSALTGAGTTWTASLSTGRGNGTLQLTFSGGPEIQDLAGNPLTPTTLNGDLYAIDKGGTVAGAGQGRPDAGFATQGYAPFSETPLATTPQVAVLPDGHLLAAGPVACDPNTFLCSLQLARFDAAGSPDPAFGQAGRLLTPVTGVGSVSALRALSDGSLVVEGLLSNDGGATIGSFVAKFTGGGALDPAFGAGGVVSPNALPAGGTFVSAEIDPAGRILVVGTSVSVAGAGTDVLVARLTPAGQLDATFGVGGVVKLGISTTGNRSDRGYSLAVQSDGRILVGGRTIGSSNTFDYLLVRLDSSGVLDPTFGTAGVVTTRLVSPGSNLGRRLALQPDGKILLFGTAPGQQCGIARLDSSGVLDAAYGVGGKVLVPLIQVCYDMTLQADGRLVLSGLNTPNGAAYYAAFARLLPGGVADPAFGTDGLVTISDYDVPAQVAVTAAGNLITSLTIEDPIDGILKSYVVKLAAQPVATSVALAVTPTASAYGESITLTASLTFAGVVAPTGVVTYLDGTADVGSPTAVAPCAPDVPGTVCAAVTVPAVAAGPHSFTATYAGDLNYATSKSAAVSATVTPAPTSIVLTSSANPSLVGQSVALAAMVTTAPSNATGPTGTVTFLDGTTSLGAVPLAAGSAILSTTALSVGSHSVSVSYSGDANYASAVSTVVVQVVNPLPPVSTTTTLSSSANPALVGQFVVYTATVAANTGTASGTVTFKQGTTTLGTVALVSGQATLTTSYATVGTRSISAVFAGNPPYQSSTSATLSEQIRAKFSTTITVTSSLNPSFIGQPVTFTAAVTATGASVPDGSLVTFTNGTNKLGTATTVAGQASLTTAALAVGTRSIRAAFAGSAMLASSISAPLGQIVAKYPTTTSLTASPTPSVYRRQVTLQATVASLGPAPTGTVTFRDGTTSLGQVSLSGGTVTLTVATLPAGSHSITATYGGDGNSAGSASAPVTQAVTPAPTSTTLSSSSNPVSAGLIVTFTATVLTPIGAPAGSVTFTTGTGILGTVNVNSNGVARVSTATLPKGTNVITATFSGIANFLGSSASLSEAVK